VRTVHLRVDAQRADLDRLAAEYRQAVHEADLSALAETLGLTVESLRRLRIGWAGNLGTWTFPMQDHVGQVRGIRLRFSDGRKKAISGGHDGLFIPDGLAYSTTLLIAEGPTDTAAMLDLGFEAAGRPSCTGGVPFCVELVRAHYPLAVVIVADSDIYGQRGAEALATTLLPYAASVRVIQPPAGIKDARAWLLAGATHEDVQEVIDKAVVRRFTVKGLSHVK
jgi:phage/plasmid primase-like uncharacterized protein